LTVDESVLELTGVTKTYEGFTLDGVSFSVPRGYIMGLVGPNGAGKTTLVRLILGLARPVAGTVRVFGLDPVENEVAVRSRIGFVHEAPALYDGLSVARAGSVVGGFYPGWDDDRFRAVAAEFELPAGRRVGALSHGMRTRFALAVALSHDAELLVLDEPTSGLDPVFRRELLDRLSGMIAEHDVSILFSTHITSDLDRVGDYITFLRRGRMVFSTSRDRVLDRWAVVRGGLELLDEETRQLFRGYETGGLGFTALTDDPDAVRARLPADAMVVERATLEDIVYLTGRRGPAGLELRGRPD
jgi:ABC-2 type transport system ATP-binding protein